jgi:membrane protease subunit HflC
MNQKIKLSLGFFTLLFILSSGLFIVDQTKQAIVLQFGELKTVYTKPGLKFKIPLIQEVTFYERRVLSYDTPPLNIMTSDQKRLIVNAYTRYKITDPLLFFQSVKPSSEAGAHLRLEPIVSSTIRNVLGKVTLPNMLTQERTMVMKKIEEEISNATKSLGITIIDVRITRSELPKENRTAVFARMNSELVRYAKENRAKGEENAQIIRAKADAEKVILLAEAERDAQKIMALGDTEAIKITNTSFGKDPEFYNFYKSLEIYAETLATEDTNLIMSTQSSFLSLLKQQPRS